ncbi:lachesin-like isoform X2, partial [Dinothrombium tinctorium]
QTKCIKVFKAKLSYEIANLVCENIHNSKVVSIKNHDDVEFLKFLAKTSNITNNLWVYQNNEESSLCKAIKGGSDELITTDCHEKHSFVCEMKAKTSFEMEIKKAIDELNAKFENMLMKHETIIAELQTQISKLNSEKAVSKSNARVEHESFVKAIGNASKLSEEADKNDILQRFFYISEKINTCAVPLSTEESPSLRNLTVIEGSDIILRCQPNGFPLPSISWISPQSTMIGTNSTLKIQKSTRYDKGEYLCVADNGVGFPLVTKFNVQVKYKPKVWIAKRKIYTGLNQNKTIECRIDANPMETIVWHKNDSNIRYEAENIHKNNTFAISLLFINVQQISDFGIYSCEAKNKYGAAIESVEVIASPPFNLTVYSFPTFEKDDFNFEFCASSYSPIQQYRLNINGSYVFDIFKNAKEMEIVEKSDILLYCSSIKLPILDLKSTYQLKVDARNEFGWSMGQKTYTFPYFCGNVTAENYWQVIVIDQQFCSFYIDAGESKRFELESEPYCCSYYIFYQELQNDILEPEMILSRERQEFTLPSSSGYISSQKDESDTLKLKFRSVN